MLSEYQMETSITTGVTAQIFEFAPSFSVRIVMRDGDPWFVAKDVAEALDYAWAGIRNVQHIPEEWRGVESVSTPSGLQEMHIMSEQGLYFFLGRSDKPKALPFQKWLAGEVLPAIRKTGRYEAPQAAQPVPPSTAERLNGNDLQHIKRAIWLCVKNFQHTESWNQAIWYYLRQVLCWKSPQPWTVDHLPRIGEELTNALAICFQVQDLIRHIEHQAANRIFRNAEDAQMVIAQLTKDAETRMADLKADRAKLPNYLIKIDLPALISRKPAFVTHYVKDEQMDFFKA